MGDQGQQRHSTKGILHGVPSSHSAPLLQWYSGDIRHVVLWLFQLHVVNCCDVPRSLPVATAPAEGQCVSAAPSAVMCCPSFVCCLGEYMAMFGGGSQGLGMPASVHHQAGLTTTG
jgi:hypothetical protein